MKNVELNHALILDTKNNKTILITAVVACLIQLVGAVIQVIEMLRSVGITSILSTVSLEGTDKVNFALYLTFVGASLVIVMWAIGLIFKGSLHLGGSIMLGGTIASFIVTIFPFILGYPSSTIGFITTVLATILIGIVSYLGYRTPRIETAKRAMLTSKEITIIAVLSALTAVLTSSTGLVLPSPTGGYTHIGDTIIYVAALLFGSKVGGIVGIIGPVVADWFVGYPRWFVTVLAHGSQGFIAGIGKKRSTIIQVILLVFSGFVMATSYFFVNIFIKGYPIAVISYVRDLFRQALVSIILGYLLSKSIKKTLPNILD